jgi:poly(hydroxyalkanoate) depolymerase family esterase
MSDRATLGMREASNLIRAGRLTEGTVLLQRMLSGAKVNLEVTNPAEGALRAHLPEALCSFLDRMTGIGPAPDAGGVARASAARSRGIADRGRFLAMSYSNQAGTRAYKLFVPSGYCSQPLPLIVMLHGCTQSADDFAAGTRMNVRADQHNCFVAYPEQAPSANPSKCWNWFRPSDQIRGQGEPSLIAGITRQIISDYSIDEKRVYAAGLSAGAAEAAILAATYSDLYAAIGVHSGITCGAASDLASAFAAMRRSQPASGGHSRSGKGGSSATVPAIVFHGDRDTTVHPQNGDQVIAQLRAGLNADLRVTVEHGRVPGGRAYTRTIYRAPNGVGMFEQWVTHGAGHAWSGGNPAGSYTDPQGPDATREMLRFFLEHPMSS